MDCSTFHCTVQGEHITWKCLFVALGFKSTLDNFAKTRLVFVFSRGLDVCTSGRAIPESRCPLLTHVEVHISIGRGPVHIGTVVDQTSRDFESSSNACDERCVLADRYDSLGEFSIKTWFNSESSKQLNLTPSERTLQIWCMTLQQSLHDVNVIQLNRDVNRSH